MFRIENIKIKFDSRTIIDESDFIAYPSQMTVIYGESGCGKTSLLDVFQQASGKYDSYTIDDQDIKIDNVHDYVASASQVPLFVNTLTMYDNILFYLTMQNTTLDQDFFSSLIQKFELNHLLKQYPASLSGGELRRFSLVTALLLQKRVILMDEPTASLDEKYTSVIIDVLKELKKSGKIIIIASHDKTIIEEADSLYEIENHTLNEKRLLAYEDDKEKAHPHHLDVSLFHLYKIIKRRVKSHKLRYFMMTFIMIVIVTMLGFSLIFGRATIQGLNDDLDSTINNQMLVYGKLNQGTDDYDPYETPALTPAQQDCLNNNDYIEKIRVCHHGKMLFPTGDENNIFVLGENGTKEKVVLDESELKLNFMSYYDDVDYSQRMIKTFHKEGVYISEELADILKIDEEHTEIEFYLAIPYKIYSPGGYISYAENTEKFYHVDFIDCTSEKVQMKIAGIYKGYNMGVCEFNDSPGAGRIYIEQSLYEEYIQKYNIKQAYTEKSRNEIIADTVDVLPYEGRSFYVTYDNEHIDELLDDLYKNDLRYINDYHDISSLLQAQENNSQMITIFGLVVFIVGCIIVLSMKYVQREETKQIYHLMRNQGLSRSSYFKMMLLQWLEDTLFICAMSSILGYGLSFVLNTLNIGYTEYNALVIVVFLIVSSTVCLLLPMISDYLTLRYEKC